MSEKKRKVLLVGWDSADWKVIHPLLDAGKLPHLEQLVNGGVIGNLATLYPVLSPMLWTSIGTGKRPYKHGIHGFAEPDPHTGGVRPITNLSRKTKAVWNILSQAGKKCVVVWWPSHPAEPLPDGVMVSNHFQRAANPDPAQPWPLPAGAVYPARLAKTLAEGRVHPHELVAEMILPFVPKAAEIDQKKDRRLEGLAKTIADCSTIQAVATQLIRSEPWDFMAVYFDAIDHFGHGFMKYHPPRQPWVPEKDFELYSGVIEAGYRYHDMMLGVLMAMAGPDTTVLLMSDHGFHPDNLRPSSIPLEPAGPAVEHRHYGIFALKGPGVKKDERVTGATVLDITPTLLALFDLPVGRDMDGKPLVNVFAETPKLETIPSWDEVPGTDGSHPSGAKLDAADAKEALKQLEALGYISPLPEDAAKAVGETQAELDYNLACSLTDTNRHAQAAEIFARLWAARPDEHRYGGKLLSCQLALGAFELARETLDRLRANRRKYGAEAAAELKRRKEELTDKKPEDLAPAQQEELRRLAAKARPATAAMRHMEATLLFAEGKAAEAVEVLQSLEKSGGTDPGFLVQLGQGFLALKRWDEAEKSFKRALELDPDNAHVSGLPRSGTSLMMQMLAAGGLPPLHDGHRPADTDNPRGYFEFASAKNIRADASWLPQAQGRAVKLVAQLLPFLPGGPAPAAAPRPADECQPYDYRIVWMERSLDEVLASQRAMLDRHGHAGAALAPEKLRAVYEQQLARVAENLERRKLAVLRIAHRDAIRDPAGSAARVAKFLGLPLNTAAMIAAVDPTLHRQKKGRPAGSVGHVAVEVSPAGAGSSRRH